MPFARLVIIAATGALVASACADAVDSSVVEGEEAATAATTTAGSPSAATDAGPVIPAGPSALDDMFSAEFPEPLVDPDAILSGGPPPDGIPAIDDPRFVPVAEADGWLSDEEPVVMVEIDGDARAYPVQVLIWHEIVNDSVGGVPVAISYCPLCNSAVSYVRRVRGVETTFGTSGRLFASALVMYDRLTESLWTHFDGRAVVGVVTGEVLEVVPSPLIAWSDFAAAHPDGLVLDRDATGFARDYGRNPYVGYDDVATTPFLFRGDLDERARAKQRVVGIQVGEAAVAVSLEAITGAGQASATPVTVGEQDLVILWQAGQATALEDDNVDGGRDVGSVGVFVPEVQGRTLTFQPDASGFVDVETGSTWSVLGKAIAGPLAGSALERVAHLDTFWFAWSTYRPGTTLVEDV